MVMQRACKKASDELVQFQNSITYTLHEVCVIADKIELCHCRLFKLKVGVNIALTILNLIIEPAKRKEYSNNCVSLLIGNWH